MKKIIKLLLFASILMAVGAGFYKMRGSSAISVVHPVRGSAVEAVYATGTVEPSVMLPVAPRSPARLMALLADEGQAVTKGQVLAQLEDEDLQKTLVELQSRADLAQKEHDRKEALVAKGAVSRESLDRAQSDLDAALAAVARAQANLDYMKLVAPEDGAVIKRDGEVGQLIAAHQPVFWLSCCDGYRVAAEVDEEDIPLVREGQKTVISADAFPGRVFDGTVQSITPKGDPVSRSYRVRIGLPGNTDLRIGMTAEANIVIREEKNALLVPAGSIRNDEVWIVKDGNFMRQKVKTGARSSRSIEIIDGLDDQSLIIMDVAQEISEGKAAGIVLKDWSP